MKIAFAASEAAPFLKTGGLGDVMQALPAALAADPQNEVVLLLPYYGAIKQNGQIKTEYLFCFDVRLGWRQCHCGVFRLKTRKKGPTVYFIDNEQYFCRSRIYGEGDDGERFAFFSKAVLASLNALSFWPDVLHCNDWQTALCPLLIRSEFAAAFPYTKTVFTIHNVEYQGWADETFNMDVLGLPARYTEVLRFGKDNAANFMKSAVVMADAVTTVSETYAEELRYPYYAHGMNDILRYYPQKLCGITNGIDEKLFDPRHDAALALRYGATTADVGKRENKLALQRELGLREDRDGAMLAMVSRLADHKGLDLLTYIADRLMSRRVQLVLLGTGEERYESYFRMLSERYPDRVAAVLRFDPQLSDRIYAAADLYLMPSKSEPCGLSQMIAMRYGAVPVVHAVGGLRDTVTPYEPATGEGRGFTFLSYNGDDFLAAIDRALALYYNEPKSFVALREKNMKLDLSWKKSAADYLSLYRKISGK